MKLRHLFFACSGVFVMMFSLLLLVVIVFSDEEDGGSGGNLIYGGVSVSQEVLAHKPMLEKYAREYGIEEYLNVLQDTEKNTPLNWQRASQGTNPAERKSPTPTLLR